MSILVIFRRFDVEVRNPAQLTIDVSFRSTFGPVGETSALKIVIFIGIGLSARRMSNNFLVAEGLVEKLLKKSNGKVNVREVEKTKKKCGLRFTVHLKR